MVQIYFLLVLCNILMGLVLSKKYLETKVEMISNLDAILSNEIFKVTLGAIGIIVGILALFLRFEGDIIIIGDLIPALLSILSGMTLFIDYVNHEETEKYGFILVFYKIFNNNRTILGFSSIAFGILHFIIPSVNLL